MDIESKLCCHFSSFCKTNLGFYFLKVEDHRIHGNGSKHDFWLSLPLTSNWQDCLLLRVKCLDLLAPSVSRLVKVLKTSNLDKKSILELAFPTALLIYFASRCRFCGERIRFCAKRISSDTTQQGSTGITDQVVKRKKGCCLFYRAVAATMRRECSWPANCFNSLASKIHWYLNHHLQGLQARKRKMPCLANSSNQESWQFKRQGPTLLFQIFEGPRRIV